MATRAEIEDAIRVADAAGRKDDVMALAGALQNMPTDAPPPEPLSVKPTADMPPEPTNVQRGSTPGLLFGKNPVTNAAANLVYGVEKSGKDTLLGLKQFITPEPNALTKAFLPKTDNDALQAAHDKLAQEAAAKEANDADLMNTTAGMVGKYGTDVATAFLPGKWADAPGKAMSLYKAAKAGVPALKAELPKLVPYLSRQAGVGAGMGVTAPDPDYDAATQAAKGAVWNVAAAGGGRGLGAIAGGIKSAAGERAREAVDIIKNSDIGKDVKMLAKNLVDSDSLIAGATNALSKLPVFGKAIKGARDQSLGAYTKEFLSRTGLDDVSVLTQKEGRNMWNALDANGASLRQGNDVPMAGIPDSLRNAASSIREYMEATSQATGTKKLTNAANALGDTVVPPTPATAAQVAAGGAFPPTVTVPKKLSASELLDVRRAASEMAYDSKDLVQQKQLYAFRDMLDEAYKNANPQSQASKLKGEPHPFDKWREQWGNAEDVKKAFDAGHEGGRFLPEKVEAILSDRAKGGAPGMHPNKKTADFENLTVAMKDQFKPPPGGENRAWLTAALLGGGAYGAKQLGDSISENPVTGIGGAAAVPGLAYYLLATEGGGKVLTGNSPKAQALAAFLRTAGRVGGGAAAHNVGTDHPKE